MDFEWLIIDDGSTDRTEEIIRSWIKECKKFTIRYYKVSNGGKCRAINKALDLAHGKLFLVIDSDDYLTDNALEKVTLWEKSIDNEGYCAVAGNLGLSEKSTPNTILEEEYYDGTALDRYGIINGERAIAFYTDIHQKYRYPEFKGEKFITEAVTWNRMAADGYRIRFYNDIICVYEYREDGLTKAGSKLFLDNPRGYGLWLKERAEFEEVSLKEKMRMYYTFTCDLSQRYSTHLIAECIGASRLVIMLSKLLHQIIGKARKRV